MVAGRPRPLSGSRQPIPTARIVLAGWSPFVRTTGENAPTGLETRDTTPDDVDAF
ncbi:hypothetical protein I552_0336 [Mycobacterium xenopi 3993]|nr:hypothetical protein I552_0336 [Mycobacterium xenopi 3993]